MNVLTVVNGAEASISKNLGRIEIVSGFDKFFVAENLSSKVCTALFEIRIWRGVRRGGSGEITYRDSLAFDQRSRRLNVCTLWLDSDSFPLLYNKQEPATQTDTDNCCPRYA